MQQSNNSQEIPAKALQSPALSYQHPKYYPASYEKKVPLQIKIIKTVTSDIPWESNLIATAGNTYYCTVNSMGAVAVLLPGNKKLGVKPSEFQIVSFHNLIR